eukprot:CAMPEP_0176002626 /NCGR_PEP_ID=MMETSP0120_2-20121206/745_1 /TAXON_ID=160619 /ORGANISM="Kryptoperidinium foliaceum, Strain CCMP 1326" /LENGTH=205 /DNA_ID=CAMNT_0017335223 /DNA_START=353 /DNA_END=967 /DNA_ORIENTATION=-
MAGDSDETKKDEETKDDVDNTIDLLEIFQSAFKRRAATVSSTPDAQVWYSQLSEEDRKKVDQGLTAISYRGCMLAAKRKFDKICTETQASRGNDAGKPNGNRRSSSKGRNSVHSTGRNGRDRRRQPPALDDDGVADGVANHPGSMTTIGDREVVRFRHETDTIPTTSMALLPDAMMIHTCTMITTKEGAAGAEVPRESAVAAERG